MRFRLHSIDPVTYGILYSHSLKDRDSQKLCFSDWHLRQTPTGYPSHGSDHIQAVEHVIDTLFGKFIESLYFDQLFWLLFAIQMHDIARNHIVRKKEPEKYGIPPKYLKDRNSYHAFVAAHWIVDGEKSCGLILPYDHRLNIARIVQAHCWYKKDFDKHTGTVPDRPFTGDETDLFPKGTYSHADGLASDRLIPLYMLLRIGDIMDIRPERAPKAISGSCAVRRSNVSHWKLLEAVSSADYEPDNHKITIHIKDTTLPGVRDSWKKKRKDMKSEFTTANRLDPGVPLMTINLALYG